MEGKIPQNGSTWNIWDFHMHTPYSILHNEFGNPESNETWEKYITQVESVAQENNVVAIGFTDYFTIEGYKKILTFKEQGRLENIFIFPNIEFRLNTYVQNRCVNLHVLFSPDIPVITIEENFLHDIDFVKENHPFDDSQKYKLKIHNLVNFGELLQQQHNKFKNQVPFYTGCMNAVVDEKQINKILLNRFHGDYLVVLAEEGLSTMDWDSQHHAVRQQLIQMSHAIFTANPKSRRFYLGQTHPTPVNFVEEFKSLKPCIHGCDSHGYEERFLRPYDNRFCWIKSEVTWNGLKQILYEPEYRVAIQENNPEPNKNIYSLSNVQIPQIQINENLRIDDTNIYLNKNLIAIIGGRGSGKTALLDLIATCFVEGKKLDELKKSFYYRVFIDKDNKNRNCESIDIKLEFLSGDIFDKKITSDILNCCFKNSNINYLTQDHFEEYSAQPNKLNKHIIDIIFEKFPDDKRIFENCQQDIISRIKEIQNINLQIQQLEDDIYGKLQEFVNELNIKQGTKEDLKQRIKISEEKNQTKTDELINLTEEQNNTRINIRNYTDFSQTLNTFIEKIASFREFYFEEVNKINQSLSTIKIPGNFQPLPESLNDLNQVKQQIENLYKNLQTEIDTQENNLAKINNKINELEGINKEIADLHLELNQIDFEIQENETNIQRIKDTEKTIDEQNEKRFSTYKLIILKVLELKKFLQEIIEKFEIDKNEMLANLTFSSKIDIDGQKKYIQSLLDKVDNRSYSESTLKDIFDIFFNKLSQVFTGNLDQNLDTAIIELKNKSQELKSRFKSSTTSSDFYNTLLAPFFEIGLIIKFNNISLKDLSMGERSIVLLKVMLALDNTPLLIDQPEEHLDNRYIYKELMPAFRDAKNRRQIIIATHNANLVVNTDAEQIIIANSKNGSLSYQVGTLENQDTREAIKLLLEGGDDAFKKREQKYGYIF